MKNIVIIIFTLSTLTSYCQCNIGSATVNSSGLCITYDSEHNQINSRYLLDGSAHFGYSSCIVVSSNSNGLCSVYDINLKEISSTYHSGKIKNISVVGSNLIILDESGMKTEYDKNMRVLNTGY